MELTVKDQVISNMPVALQPYIKARLNKPIKQVEDQELFDMVGNIILQAYWCMGISPNSEKVTSFLRETLIRDLRGKKYEQTTLEEIELYVNNGVRGEYGTFKSQLSAVNVQNLHYWIKCGMESKQKELAMKAYNDELSKLEKAEKPLQLKINDTKEGIKSAFEAFKKSVEAGNPEGTLPPCAHKYYQALCEILGVQTLLPQDQRNEIFTRIRDEFDKQTDRSIEAAKLRGDRDMVKMLESLSERPKSKQDSINNKTQSEYLRQVFKNKMKEGKDIDF